VLELEQLKGASPCGDVHYDVLLLLSWASSALAQANAAVPPKPASEVAGIAVNYDETQVGTYTLPMRSSWLMARSERRKDLAQRSPA